MEMPTNVIRNIELLPLSPKVMEIAKELLEQIDMQVVFWINSELENNISSRHMQQKNQFWVTVKPQDDSAEFERLILAGLYRGIQERKRYTRVWWKEEYVQQIKNKDHIEQYYKFLNFINSFATSLETEMFLRRHDITTSEKVKKQKFEYVLKKLEEYIQKRRKLPYFKWYRETEVWNLLEYANFWRWGYTYQKRLKKLICKVNQEYIRTVESVSYKINDFMARYNGENGEELITETVQYIIMIFHLEHMIRLYKPMTKEGRFIFRDGSESKVISCIPEDYPNQKLLINWFKLSGECISIIRETYGYDMPDVGFSLIQSDQCNEYVNDDGDNGYFISCTTGHIVRVHECMEDYDIYEFGNHKLIDYLGMNEYRKRLFRFVVFYITAHEYAHILNSDCNKSVDNPKKESLADEKAKELIELIIPLQYRFVLKPEDNTNLFHYYLTHGEFENAIKIIEELPEERRREMKDEVNQIYANCRQDNVILKDAIVFVNDYRVKVMS